MLTTHYDTPIHEAGHAIMKYLASDLFVIDFVTANTQLSQQIDGRSRGWTKSTIQKDPDFLTARDLDIIVLISLAGMVADDVNHTDGIIDESFYNHNVFTEKINLFKYGGDRVMLIGHLDVLVPQLKVEYRPYINSCKRILYDLFTKDWLIETLVGLRNLIANAETVSGTEVTAFLDATQLKSWKENEWQDILNSRSDLFRQTAF